MAGRRHAPTPAQPATRLGIAENAKLRQNDSEDLGAEPAQPVIFQGRLHAALELAEDICDLIFELEALLLEPFEHIVGGGLVF